MPISKLHASIAAAAAFSMAATPVLAATQENSSSRTMRDIIGRDSDDATRMIKDRNYTYVEGSHDKYGNKHTYWWNERADNCLHVTSYRGNVVDAADAKDKDCNQGGGNTAAAVGAVAGIALLGALLAKKHHKKGKEYDEQGEAEFERGFRDGLHHAQYHNYSRTDAYSDGYQAGVEQREANLSHHTGGSGYQADARYSDLIGARATAIDQLGGRGFTQVDNFVSGNARYSIWWRGQSRQCLQVITADGRLENITDIQTHPKCR